MTKVLIEFKSSVLTGAGWRSVWMRATAEKISEKRVKVLEVTHIDDEPISFKMSRTGSKRQEFNAQHFANEAAGAIKNISALHSIEVVK